MSPLRKLYLELSYPYLDHIHLAQDAILHNCNECFVRDINKEGMKDMTFWSWRWRYFKHGWHSSKRASHQSTNKKEWLWNQASTAPMHPLKKGCPAQLNYVSGMESKRQRLDPNLFINKEEIEAVSKYCMTYSGKTHHTTQRRWTRSKILSWG